MKSTNIVDVCSNNDPGEVVVKLEPGFDESSMQQKECRKTDLASYQKLKSHFRRQESEENRTSSALGSGHSGLSIVEQESSANDSSPCSMSPISSAPICRQFWKAGNYDECQVSKISLQNATSYLHIHPRFLHSNATSHKWAFGAVAELLDNAVDEIQRGATFVNVDKTSNPRDGNPALLIQDDGGGMDPEAIRRCLSFGFSDKTTNSAIGRYGNGFKTSTMRLGADVVVFSRCIKNRKLTQSVGLLSYTFLMQTGHDRIVVPMVNYEFDASTGKWNTLHTKQHFESNLSLILRWSPYLTEAEILNQFQDVGNHGTKIIVYNLWCNDEGKMELDFDSDPEDICIHGGSSSFEKGGSRMSVSEQHLANRLRYSLRAYLSILYLRQPEKFSMLLRGRVVECHNIANDLKYPEFILYRPQSGGNVEGSVITTIGFLKEAPLVNIHGFNVYHKNRLILPFWHVVSYSDSRGRGVVGVLEANFIEPSHNKQEFERTSVFQKLEKRLKEMTWEYWDYHCGLIGYQVKKKPPISQGSSTSAQLNSPYQPVLLSGNPSAATTTKTASAPEAIQRQTTASSKSFIARSANLSTSKKYVQHGTTAKRRERDYTLESEIVKRKAGEGANEANRGQQSEPGTTATFLEDQEAANLMQENKKLRTQCSEYEKRQEELNLKATSLRTELKQAQREYARLLVESRILEKGIRERNIA